MAETGPRCLKRTEKLSQCRLVTVVGARRECEHEAR